MISKPTFCLLNVFSNEQIWQTEARLSVLIKTYNEVTSTHVETVCCLGKNTVITAILAISIAYIIALLLLIVMFITSQTSYCFFTLVIPLLVYIWLITYGGIKHVNNIL